MPILIACSMCGGVLEPILISAGAAIFSILNASRIKCIFCRTKPAQKDSNEQD